MSELAHDEPPHEKQSDGEALQELAPHTRSVAPERAARNVSAQLRLFLQRRCGRDAIAESSWSMTLLTPKRAFAYERGVNRLRKLHAA